MPMARSLQVLALSICCCQAVPVIGDAAGAGQLPELPPIEYPKNQDWYPAAWKRAGLEGRVLVSFDISPAGRVAHLAVIWAENPDLRTHTIQLLEGARFQVSGDWPTTGARQHWRAGFVYCLPPSGQSDEFATPARTIYIRSSRIPGLKVNHPPAPGATGPCATGN